MKTQFCFLIFVINAVQIFGQKLPDSIYTFQYYNNELTNDFARNVYHRYTDSTVIIGSEYISEKNAFEFQRKTVEVKSICQGKYDKIIVSDYDTISMEYKNTFYIQYLFDQACNESKDYLISTNPLDTIKLIRYFDYDNNGNYKRKIEYEKSFSTSGLEETYDESRMIEYNSKNLIKNIFNTYNDNISFQKKQKITFEYDEKDRIIQFKKYDYDKGNDEYKLFLSNEVFITDSLKVTNYFVYNSSNGSLNEYYIDSTFLDKDGYPKFSNYHVYEPFGLELWSQKDIYFYPPTTASIEEKKIETFSIKNIISTNSTLSFTIENHNQLDLSAMLFDALGHIIYQVKTEKTELDLSFTNLSSGIYFIQLKSQNGQKIKRVIIY